MVIHWEGFDKQLQTMLFSLTRSKLEDNQIKGINDTDELICVQKFCYNFLILSKCKYPVSYITQKLLCLIIFCSFEPVWKILACDYGTPGK